MCKNPKLTLYFFPPILVISDMINASQSSNIHALHNIQLIDNAGFF